jgi:hypothetical protein
MPLAVALVVAVCAAMMIAAERRRWAPPVAVTMGVGLAVRVAAVAATDGHTPIDVRVWFRGVARMAVHGQDPLTHTSTAIWNFLPLTAFALVVALVLPVSWVVGQKVLMIAADLVVVWLVGSLSGSDAAHRRMLYAVCPIAVIVTGYHGQLEPLGLALGLGAFAAARGGRAGAAGVLLGLAVSIKSWPVVLLPGVLRDVGRGGRLRCAEATAVVLTAQFVLMAVVSDAPTAAVRRLAAHEFIGGWGWSAIVRVMAPTLSQADWKTVVTIGTVLTVLAVAAVLVRLWPAGDGITISTALFLAVIATTAGFAPQYVLWCVPFLVVRGVRRLAVPAALAASWMLAAYASRLSGPYTMPLGLASLAAVVAAALEVARIVRERPRVAVA